MSFKLDLIEAIKKNNLSEVLINESFDAVQEFWMTADTALPDKIESAFKIDTTEYICTLKRANVKGLYLCEFGMIANKFMKFWKFKSTTHIRPGIATLIKIIEASIPFLNANIAGIAIKIPASNTKDYSLFLNKVLMKTHLKTQWASLNVDNTLSSEYQYVFLMRKSKNIGDVFKSKAFDAYKLGDSTEVSHAGTAKKKATGSIHIGNVTTTEIPAAALDAIVPIKHSPPTHNITPSTEFKYPDTPVIADIKSAETALKDAPVVTVATPPPSAQPVVTSEPDKNVVLNDDQTKEAYGKLFDTAMGMSNAKVKLPLVLAFMMRDNILKYSSSKEFYEAYVKGDGDAVTWSNIRLAAQKSDIYTLAQKSGKNPTDILKMKGWLKGYGKIGYSMYSAFLQKFGDKLLSDTAFYDQIYKAATLTAGYAQAAPLTSIPIKLKKEKKAAVEYLTPTTPTKSNPIFDAAKKVNYDAVKKGISYLDGSTSGLEPTKLLTQALSILLIEFIAKYSSEDELRSWINSIGDGTQKAIFSELNDIANLSPYYTTYEKLKPFGFSGFPQYDKFVTAFGENYLKDSSFAFELWWRYTHYYKKDETPPPTPVKSTKPDWAPSGPSITAHYKKDIDGVVFEAMSEIQKVVDSLDDKFLSKNHSAYKDKEAAIAKQKTKPSYLKYNSLKSMHRSIVESYTNGSYSSINDIFRTYLKSGDYNGHNKGTLKYTNSLFDAYQETPLEEGIYVWRGVDTPGVKIPNKIQSIDEDYIDPGYLSTSMDYSCGFVSGSTKNTVLQIFLPKGSIVIPILYNSSHPGEHEVILPPFSILRPYDIKVIGSTQYIKCVFMGSGRKSYIAEMCKKINLIQEEKRAMVLAGLKTFREFIMENDDTEKIKKSDKDNDQKINDVGPSLDDIKKANQMVKSGKIKVKKD